MDKKDRISLAISLVALMLSGGNIAYTIHKDAKDQSENVSCDVRRVLDDYDTTVRPSGGAGGILVKWQGVVANNGTVPVAFVEHRLLNVETNGRLEYQSGLDAGLFDTHGNPLSFPINLAPGQAIPFIQLTEVPIRKQIYDVLNYGNSLAKPINSRELMLSLGEEHGVDFWENPVSVTRYSKTRVSYSGPSDTSTIDIPALIAGEPMSLYIIVPPPRITAYRPLLRVWISGLILAMTQRTQLPAERTLMLCDEAGNIGRIDALFTAATLLRSWGLTLWTLWQNAAQLQIYGTQANTLVDNAGVIQVFGARNLRMAQDMANIIGGVSAEQILNMEKDEQILLIEGTMMRCKQARYYNDKLFQVKSA